MSRKLCVVVLVALVAVGLGPVSVDAKTKCGRKTPQVVDQKGDATAFTAIPSGFPNEDSLDVTSSFVTWDKKKKSLTFTIAVADLEANPPTVGNGKIFRLDFTHARRTYELVARSINVPPAEGYALTVQTDTTPVTLDPNLQGSFDSQKERVTIVLPLGLFNEKAGDYWEAQNQSKPPALAKGSKLETFVVLGQRYIGPGPAITATADTAEGQCPYVVG